MVEALTNAYIEIDISLNNSSEVGVRILHNYKMHWRICRPGIKLCIIVAPKPEQEQQKSEEVAEVNLEIVEKTLDPTEKVDKPEEEEVKDAWDASSSEEDESEETSTQEGKDSLTND